MMPLLYQGRGRKREGTWPIDWLRNLCSHIQLIWKSWRKTSGHIWKQNMKHKKGCPHLAVSGRTSRKRSPRLSCVSPKQEWAILSKETTWHFRFTARKHGGAFLKWDWKKCARNYCHEAGRFISIKSNTPNQSCFIHCLHVVWFPHVLIDRWFISLCFE